MLVTIAVVSSVGIVVVSMVVFTVAAGDRDHVASVVVGYGVSVRPAGFSQYVALLRSRERT